MIDKEAYIKKMEAEVEQAKAKLAEWKDKAKSAAAEGGATADKALKSTHEKVVTETESMYDSLKDTMKELGEASEDAWDQIKDKVENAWEKLSAAIRESADKFKG